MKILVAILLLATLTLITGCSAARWTGNAVVDAGEWTAGAVWDGTEWTANALWDATPYILTVGAYAAIAYGQAAEEQHARAQANACACGSTILVYDGTEVAGARIWKRYRCTRCGRVQLRR
jgi:hypothetical protein